MSASTPQAGLARERLAARRAQVRRIRRTVLAIGITLFVALFVTIYVQMASGRDPALAASSSNVATPSEASSSDVGTTTSTDAAATTSGESDASTGSGEVGSQAPTPVVTSQS